MKKETRAEMYERGCFFVRKRHLNPRCRLNLIAPDWAIYVSRSFGRWTLLRKFDSESECDEEIEGIAAEYDNCIIE